LMIDLLQNKPENQLEHHCSVAMNEWMNAMIKLDFCCKVTTQPLSLKFWCNDQSLEFLLQWSSLNTSAAKPVRTSNCKFSCKPREP
jgi:hypothetical protein